MHNCSKEVRAPRTPQKETRREDTRPYTDAATPHRVVVNCKYTQGSKRHKQTTPRSSFRSVLPMCYLQCDCFSREGFDEDLAEEPTTHTNVRIKLAEPAASAYELTNAN